MNISSVNPQLQIQHYPPQHLHAQLPGDLLLIPQPVSSPIQHALLGVAFSRNTVASMSAPPDSVIRKLSAVKRHDTHSKILTAQGLRDRRVRLSVGIARRFFDLQEMLGFDKASKTLEWLLGKAADSIEILAQTTKSSPSNSRRCVGNDGLTASLSSIHKAVPRKVKEKKAASLISIKTPKILNVLARDQSRAQARARARERTLGKFMNSQLRALMGTQLDGFSLDQLTSQSPDGMLPPTTARLHKKSLGHDDPLEVAKQNVERARKLSLDLLHHHKELVVGSEEAYGLYSSSPLFQKEWDHYY